MIHKLIYTCRHLDMYGSMCLNLDAVYIPFSNEVIDVGYHKSRGTNERKRMIEKYVYTRLCEQWDASMLT